MENVININRFRFASFGRQKNHNIMQAKKAKSNNNVENDDVRSTTWKWLWRIPITEDIIEPKKNTNIRSGVQFTSTERTDIWTKTKSSCWKYEYIAMELLTIILEAK